MEKTNLYPSVVVNIDAVMDYCKNEHCMGRLGMEPFRSFVPIIKMAVDAYLKQPCQDMEYLLSIIADRCTMQQNLMFTDHGARRTAIAALSYLGVVPSIRNRLDILERRQPLLQG